MAEKAICPKCKGVCWTSSPKAESKCAYCEYYGVFDDPEDNPRKHKQTIDKAKNIYKKKESG